VSLSLISKHFHTYTRARCAIIYKAEHAGNETSANHWGKGLELHG